MAIGFDFGTANCSVSHIVDNKVQAIKLANNEFYLPSTLAAPTREAVSEHLYRHFNIQPIGEIAKNLLRSSINANREEGIDVKATDILFGLNATTHYLEDPADTYYVKSPKSFLGTQGLSDIRLAIFEDIVCAMMANVKRHVELSLNKEVCQTVIGRPINFHNRGGEKSNQQAQNILYKAAKRAGFKDIEFQFEPVAAGLEYESTLTADKNVLIVDIGGGTTDCSIIKMGPNWLGKKERQETLLAHAGCFTGGNDLDIHIAFKKFMTSFGKDGNRHSGLPMPTMQFWDAIAINDVEAQRKFYIYNNLKSLKDLHSEAIEPQKIARLLNVYNNTLGHSVVSDAEQAKIALSSTSEHIAVIDLLSEQLEIPISLAQMEEAVIVPIEKIKKLVGETVAQASETPDVVYITGGSARSPLIQNAVKSVIKDTPLVSGDYFGSVTSGLARWSNLCFK